MKGVKLKQKSTTTGNNQNFLIMTEKTEESHKEKMISEIKQ